MMSFCQSLIEADIIRYYSVEMMSVSETLIEADTYALPIQST